MIADDAWAEGNARYLAAAFAWLRLRFEDIVDGDGPSSSMVDRIVEAEKELAACAAQMQTPPALVLLSRSLGLSHFEQQVLLLCVAMELDTLTADRCACAQGHAARAFPTFALALALFPDPAWEALSPERPLRYWRLIDVHRNGELPLTASALRADERIVNYVKGLNHLDERLMAFTVPMDRDDGTDPLQRSQQAGIDRIVHAWERAGHASQCPVVQLLGSDAPSKQRIAIRAAAQVGRHLHKVTADLLPTGQAELDSFARLWEREARLMPVALFIDWNEAAGGATGHTTLNRLLARAEGLFFVDTRELLQKPGRPSVAVDVAKPTAAEQRDAWTAVLGRRAAENPAALSAQFNLDMATINRVAGIALDRTPSGRPLLAARLWDECMAAVRPGLDALAQRLDAKATWDDIVLPPEQLALLRQVTDQVRCRGRVYQDWGFAHRMNRGLGISALFEGASGVGKTMAAEVIANDLRLGLYRIDLSTVISKYLGETEGNLRRLFDAADDGGAILFFDECDALFGKRSEVKDSHDRYANIETNYLLQRIEAYRGLAILATNMKSALDPAFVRRLRFIVNFPFPGSIERQEIWRRAFPSGVPLADLDFERLGRINLAGGSIHSAALGAAFLAARAESAVDMDCVLSALRTEFVKLGRPVNEADFRVVGRGGMAA